MASSSESNRDRRERLRQLALETIDINKDPYFMKNHLGSYECKLCLTLHNNEVSTPPFSPLFCTGEVTLVGLGPATQSQLLTQYWSGFIEFQFFPALEIRAQPRA